MKSYSKDIATTKDNKTLKHMIYASIFLHVVEIAAIIALFAKVL